MALLIHAVLISRTIICSLLAMLLLACTPISNNISHTPVPEDTSQDTRSSTPNIEESRSEVEDSIPNIEDGGFLSGEPCGPPCFWSITPGVTTETEAIKVFQAKGLFQTCKTFDNEAESGGRGIICRSIAVVSFKLGTDIVDSVGFRPSRKMTVQDVIAKYGEPDAVSVTASSIPEDPHTVMSLYYDEIRTRLNLPEQDSYTFWIEPSTEIENVGYFDITSYRGSLRDSSPAWKGYGEYQQNEPQ